MKRRGLDLIWIPLVLVAVAAAYSVGLLPGQVYGALLGALLTLLGVELKSRNDAELRRIELKHSLRREVFLEVAEGIAASTKYLEQLAQPDADERHEPPGAPRAWVQKLELVASPPTVILARAAGTVHTEIVLELMKRRAKIQKLDFDMKMFRDQHSRLLEVQQTIFKQFSDAIGEAETTMRAQKLQTASDAQAQLRQSFADNEAEQSRLSRERSHDHRELARAALRGSMQHGKDLTRLQNAIRREIGGIDNTATEDLPDEEITSSEKHLDDLMDYIEELWKREDNAG
ncbi:MAG TPA: hypothetical protein VGQ65_09510 [Thermoanaerobaculia bacterium]|jgi:hypothetical protein|nr:hypothetical protein [Thermoanaerobaculia bacterium]